VSPPSSLLAVFAQLLLHMLTPHRLFYLSFSPPRSRPFFVRPSSRSCSGRRTIASGFLERKPLHLSLAALSQSPFGSRLILSFYFDSNFWVSMKSPLLDHSAQNAASAKLWMDLFRDHTTEKVSSLPLHPFLLSPIDAEPLDPSSVVGLRRRVGRLEG
jgi:hypothetical protein